MKYFMVTFDNGSPIYFDHPGGRILCLTFPSAQEFLKENFDNQSCRYLLLGNTSFVFQTFGNVHLCASSDEDPLPFLRRQLTRLYDLFRFRLGPTLRPAGMSAFSAFNPTAMRPLVSAFVNLCKTSHAFLAMTGYEDVEVSDEVRNDCASVMDQHIFGVPLEKCKRSFIRSSSSMSSSIPISGEGSQSHQQGLKGIPNAYASYLFVGNKVLARAHRRGSPYVSSQDVANLIIFCNSVFNPQPPPAQPPAHASSSGSEKKKKKSKKDEKEAKKSQKTTKKKAMEVTKDEDGVQQADEPLQTPEDKSEAQEDQHLNLQMKKLDMDSVAEQGQGQEDQQEEEEEEQQQQQDSGSEASPPPSADQVDDPHPSLPLRHSPPQDIPSHGRSKSDLAAYVSAQLQEAQAAGLASLDVIPSPPFQEITQRALRHSNSSHSFSSDGDDGDEFMSAVDEMEHDDERQWSAMEMGGDMGMMGEPFSPAGAALSSSSYSSNSLYASTPANGSFLPSSLPRKRSRILSNVPIQSLNPLYPSSSSSSSSSSLPASALSQLLKSSPSSSSNPSPQPLPPMSSSSSSSLASSSPDGTFDDPPSISQDTPPLASSGSIILEPKEGDEEVGEADEKRVNFRPLLSPSTPSNINNGANIISPSSITSSARATPGRFRQPIRPSIMNSPAVGAGGSSIPRTISDVMHFGHQQLAPSVIHCAQISEHIRLVVITSQNRVHDSDRELFLRIEQRVRMELRDFEDFLVTKERTHISMLPFLYQCPGLVHFMLVDRLHNRVLAPTISSLHANNNGSNGSSSSSASAVDPAAAVLQSKIWSMIQLCQEQLERGYTEALIRDTGACLQCCFKLCAEDEKGNELAVVDCSRERAVQLGYARYYELYTIYISMVSLQCVASYSRRLTTLLFDRKN